MFIIYPYIFIYIDKNLTQNLIPLLLSSLLQFFFSIAKERERENDNQTHTHKLLPSLTITHVHARYRRCDFHSSVPTPQLVAVLNLVPRSNCCSLPVTSFAIVSYQNYISYMSTNLSFYILFLSNFCYNFLDLSVHGDGNFPWLSNFYIIL